MKSKSILFILIAAIALGSFTACSNGPTAPIYGSEVQGVTLASAPGYLAGHTAKWLGVNDTKTTFNPADVTLNVLFNDGASLPFSGKELNLTLKSAGDDEWMFVGSNVFEVTFADKKTFNVNIDAYSIESIDVDLSGIEATTLPLDKAGKYTADDIDLTGISMIVKYNGGQPKDVSEKIADNANVKASVVAALNKLTANAKADQAVTIDASNIVVVYDENNYSLDQLKAAIPGCPAINVSGAKTLTITDKAEQSIVSMEVERIYGADGSGEIFYVGKNTLEQLQYQVTLTLSDEEEPVVIKSTELEDGVKDGWEIKIISHVADWAFSKENDSATVTIRAKNAAYGEKTATLDVEAIEDYPIAFAAPVANKVNDKDAAWDADSKVSANQFTFKLASTGAWASGYAYSGTGETAPAWDEDNFTASISGFKASSIAGEKYTVEFTYGGYQGKQAVAKPTYAITLAEEGNV